VPKAAADATKAPGKSAAGRKSAASAAPRNPLRNFTLWVALPTAAVYVVGCVLVLWTLQLMTGEINRVDGDRARKAMAAALGSIAQQLGEHVGGQANWTEAYLNSYVNLNPAWLDSTWGDTARDDGYYDTAVVTDSGGAILFGESSAGPLSGTLDAHYSATAASIAALDSAIAAEGDDAVVWGLARRGDGIAAVAAAVIHGAGGQISVPAADRRILWLSRTIDPGMLKDLAHRFQIPVPRLGPDESAGPGEDTLALVDASGAPIGHLVWRPLRPGDAAFLHATGVASVVLLIIGGLLFVVLHAFRRNVERRAEIEERDWFSARYDLSTGLLNRFGLEESISRLIPRRQGELNVAIACIEFEGVKDVIGSYGEETAEALLDRLAELIDSGIDGGAQIARLGPDEFALWRTGEDAGPLIRRHARVVLSIVAESIPLGDLRLKLAASIGVAEASVTRKTIGEALLLAGAALQRARETGGNHVIEFEPSLEADRRARLALQADIRRGLTANEFDLEYQPIFDFSTEAMLGVEALLRWPHRAGGAMSPGEFIPAAEASGLIEELGLFALRKACAEILPLGDIKLSVNVSTVQFRSPTLATQIDDILASTGFPAWRLQLEITESFLLLQADRAKAIIEELRGRGISIALDDFGTGFSSVGYLRQFSCDRVKLDRSLVEDVDVDPVKAALVESTMVFAFALGLAVTAEGVERREEAAVLTRLGCNEFQGYLFSRPLKLDALSRLAAATPMKRAG
jgi:diguanylate cyclase (GGDEF)-like protein